MAGAVPGAVGGVPAENAAHMGTDRRHRVEPALLVAEGGDVVAIDLEDRGVAGRQLVEALRLPGEVAGDQVSGDLGILLDELAGAGDRLDAGGVEHRSPRILLAGGE